MGKFITNFALSSELATASAKTDGSFGRPHVSLTKDDGQVHFFRDPYNGHDYVDLGLPSGTMWAKMNIGASSETDYGLYFQWGDAQGYTAAQVGCESGKKCFDSDTWFDYKYGPVDWDDETNYGMTKYNSTDGKTVLDASDDAAVANMGGSWRMPTEIEFNELLNTSNCTKAWTTNYNGTSINGYLFTSVRNSNTLFFPAAGICDDGSVLSVGSVGNYWSSSLSTSDVFSGRYLYFYSGNCNMDDNLRYDGFSVRGVVGQ